MGIGAKLELLLQEHHMNANELAKKNQCGNLRLFIR